MGVDKIAHQACLEAGGKTIAVLGSGFLHIYPAMNTNLANEIANKGLLVSEYAPHISPNKFNFPARNRIVAGLSEGVLLTEAGEKSGTLYTKEFALEFGRSVYVVPGNINSALSKGTNNLIKHMQGSIVLEYKDILLDLGIEDGNKKQILQLNVNESLIISHLENESLHFDEIAQLTKLDAKTLNSCLTTLSIRGIIKKLPGNFYSL
jgi:DNA processing protein